MNKSIKQQMSAAKKNVAAIQAKASKMKMPKMPKVSRKQAMVAAGALAGATLLGTIAGVSIYFVKNRKRKVDFKKVKINVMKTMKNAHSKMAPMAAKASKMASKAAKEVHASAKDAHANLMARVA